MRELLRMELFFVAKQPQYLIISLSYQNNTYLNKSLHYGVLGFWGFGVTNFLKHFALLGFSSQTLGMFCTIEKEATICFHTSACLDLSCYLLTLNVVHDFQTTQASSIHSYQWYWNAIKEFLAHIAKLDCSVLLYFTSLRYFGPNFLKYLYTNN